MNRNSFRLTHEPRSVKARTQVSNLRYSRNERIPGRVAEDPKENQQNQPGPEINRRDKDAAMRLTSDRAFRETEEAIHDEWQGHHHQRIQLERDDRMQVQ